jgi:hypothetical protein
MAGAPLGNQNAAKGKKWKAAVDRALGEKSRVLGKEALDECARVLIEQALAGEQWAIKELGDRLDGKPTQQTEVSGPDGGPVETVTRFRLADLG